MDLSRIIVGPIVTEKTERLKGGRVFTFEVAAAATKIEVAQALKRFYDITPTQVRVLRVPPKARMVGRNQPFTKRSRMKKAIVTLGKESKALDLAQFKTI